jgi:hypothetical protein
MDDKLAEYFIQCYGEKYRHLIIDSLIWLEKIESKWNLDSPLDRKAYIADIIQDANKTACSTKSR